MRVVHSSVGNALAMARINLNRIREGIEYI